MAEPPNPVFRLPVLGAGDDTIRDTPHWGRVMGGGRADVIVEARWRSLRDVLGPETSQGVPTAKVAYVPVNSLGEASDMLQTELTRLIPGWRPAFDTGFVALVGCRHAFMVVPRLALLPAPGLTFKRLAVVVDRRSPAPIGKATSMLTVFGTVVLDCMPDVELPLEIDVGGTRVQPSFGVSAVDVPALLRAAQSGLDADRLATVKAFGDWLAAAVGGACTVPASVTVDGTGAHLACRLPDLIMSTRSTPHVAVVARDAAFQISVMTVPDVTLAVLLDSEATLSVGTEALAVRASLRVPATDGQLPLPGLTLHGFTLQGLLPVCSAGLSEWGTLLTSPLGQSPALRASVSLADAGFQVAVEATNLDSVVTMDVPGAFDLPPGTPLASLTHLRVAFGAESSALTAQAVLFGQTVSASLEFPTAGAPMACINGVSLSDTCTQALRCGKALTAFGMQGTVGGTTFEIDLPGRWARLRGLPLTLCQPLAAVTGGTDKGWLHLTSVTVAVPEDGPKTASLAGDVCLFGNTKLGFEVNLLSAVPGVQFNLCNPLKLGSVAAFFLPSAPPGWLTSDAWPALEVTASVTPTPGVTARLVPGGAGPLGPFCGLLSTVLDAAAVQLEVDFLAGAARAAVLVGSGRDTKWVVPLTGNALPSSVPDTAAELCVGLPQLVLPKFDVLGWASDCLGLSAGTLDCLPQFRVRLNVLSPRAAGEAMVELLQEPGCKQLALCGLLFVRVSGLKGSFTPGGPPTQATTHPSAVLDISGEVTVGGFLGGDPVPISSCTLRLRVGRSTGTTLTLDGIDLSQVNAPRTTAGLRHILGMLPQFKLECVTGAADVEAKRAALAALGVSHTLPNSFVLHAAPAAGQAISVGLGRWTLDIKPQFVVAGTGPRDARLPFLVDMPLALSLPNLNATATTCLSLPDVFEASPDDLELVFSLPRVNLGTVVRTVTGDALRLGSSSPDLAANFNLHFNGTSWSMPAFSALVYARGTYPVKDLIPLPRCDLADGVRAAVGVLGMELTNAAVYVASPSKCTKAELTEALQVAGIMDGSPDTVLQSLDTSWTAPVLLGHLTARPFSLELGCTARLVWCLAGAPPTTVTLDLCEESPTFTLAGAVKVETLKAFLSVPVPAATPVSFGGSCILSLETGILRLPRFEVKATANLSDSSLSCTVSGQRLLDADNNGFVDPFSPLGPAVRMFLPHVAFRACYVKMVLPDKPPVPAFPVEELIFHGEVAPRRYADLGHAAKFALGLRLPVGLKPGVKDAVGANRGAAEKNAGCYLYFILPMVNISTLLAYFPIIGDPGMPAPTVALLEKLDPLCTMRDVEFSLATQTGTEAFNPGQPSAETGLPEKLFLREGITAYVGSATLLAVVHVDDLYFQFNREQVTARGSLCVDLGIVYLDLHLHFAFSKRTTRNFLFASGTLGVLGLTVDTMVAFGRMCTLRASDAFSKWQLAKRRLGGTHKELCDGPAGGANTRRDVKALLEHVHEDAVGMVGSVHADLLLLKASLAVAITSKGSAVVARGRTNLLERLRGIMKSILGPLGSAIGKAIGWAVRDVNFALFGWAGQGGHVSKVRVQLDVTLMGISANIDFTVGHDLDTLKEKLLKEVTAWLKSIIKWLLERLGKALECIKKVLDAIAKALSGLLDAVGFGDALKNIADMLNNVLPKIPGLKGMPLFNFGGGGSNSDGSGSSSKGSPGSGSGPGSSDDSGDSWDEKVDDIEAPEPPQPPPPPPPPPQPPRKGKPSPKRVRGSVEMANVIKHARRRWRCHGGPGPECTRCVCYCKYVGKGPGCEFFGGGDEEGDEEPVPPPPLVSAGLPAAGAGEPPLSVKAVPVVEVKPAPAPPVPPKPVTVPPKPVTVPLKPALAPPKPAPAPPVMKATPPAGGGPVVPATAAFEWEFLDSHHVVHQAAAKERGRLLEALAADEFALKTRVTPGVEGRTPAVELDVAELPPVVEPPPHQQRAATEVDVMDADPDAPGVQESKSEPVEAPPANNKESPGAVSLPPMLAAAALEAAKKSSTLNFDGGKVQETAQKKRRANTKVASIQHGPFAVVPTVSRVPFDHGPSVTSILFHGKLGRITQLKLLQGMETLLPRPTAVRGRYMRAVPPPQVVRPPLPNWSTEPIPQADGELRVWSIAALPNTNLVAGIDKVDKAVVLFNAACAKVGDPVAPGMVDPTAIAATAGGIVLVADGDSCRVFRFRLLDSNKGLEHVDTMDWTERLPAGSKLWGVCVDGAGRVVVSAKAVGGHTVVGDDGVALATDGLQFPTALAATPGGDVCMVDSSAPVIVRAVGPGGTVASTGGFPLTKPRDVAVSPCGHILVANVKGYCVLSPAFVLLKQAALGRKVQGVAVSVSAGHGPKIFVSEPSPHRRVRVFSVPSDW